MAVDFRQLQRAPWTWACLPCNTTGTGPSNVHRCPAGDHAWRREFWRQRLRFARVGIGEANAMLEEPVARAVLVRIFGERWLPEYTAPMESNTGARKEAA
jgi:hypothetical protein